MTVSTPAIELGVQRPPTPPRTPPAPALPRLTSTRASTRRASSPPVQRPHTQMEARSRRMVQALVEIIDGARPATQLLRMASESVYDDLVGRLESLGGASSRGAATVGPLSTRVASVHVEQPTDSCAEISARIVQGSRSRALALRLDLVEGRWMCSAMNWG